MVHAHACLHHLTVSTTCTSKVGKASKQFQKQKVLLSPELQRKNAFQFGKNTTRNSVILLLVAVIKIFLNGAEILIEKGSPNFCHYNPPIACSTIMKTITRQLPTGYSM